MCVGKVSGGRRGGWSSQEKPNKEKCNLVSHQRAWEGNNVEKGGIINHSILAP